MKQKIKNLIKKLLFINSQSDKVNPYVYDFNKSNPLGGNGERVDIHFKDGLNFENLDMYQKNHLKRYDFAISIIQENDMCADLACGTGYGSVMISEKAQHVTGIDLNEAVILEIQKRYENNSKVKFLSGDLLSINFENQFDEIISFETIEHFTEDDILRLLTLFNKGLKANGKLIFSTPYLQEQTEDAIKLGFHLTFNINEEKISKWLNSKGFKLDYCMFQNYETHEINSYLEKIDFIICVATKM